MVNYPASLDALVTLTSSTKMNDAGYEGDTLINALNRIAEALEAKVGTGASTPTAGNILAATSTGVSGWASTVAINGSLAPGAVSGTPAQHALYRENVVKAWVIFNGTGTVAILDSFNVSSITDGGVGQYQVVWDRDFATANYAMAGMTSQGATTYDGGASAGSGGVLTYDLGSPTLVDRAAVCVIAVGKQ